MLEGLEIGLHPDMEMRERCALESVDIPEGQIHDFNTFACANMKSKGMSGDCSSGRRMSKPSISPTLVGLFEALADPTRLRLINLIRSGEVCVCFFVEVLGEPQPKISRHLAYLRRNEIVEDRREGKWMHYRISASLPEEAGRILETLSETFESDPLFVRDLAALDRLSCSTRVSSTLRRAPRPNKNRR